MKEMEDKGSIKLDIKRTEGIKSLVILASLFVKIQIASVIGK